MTGHRPARPPSDDAPESPESPEGTAASYRRFAETEARGNSPTHERLALAVAGDAEVVTLVQQSSII